MKGAIMDEIFKTDLTLVKKIFIKLVIIGTILILVLFSGLKVFAQTIPINIDVSKKYQTIDNFSASDCWWAHEIGKYWTNANKDSVADLLFSTTKGIGLSAWRFNLTAGSDPTITDSWRTGNTFEVSPGKYDWSADEGGQWFLQAAKERGVNQFIAFVNSPPINMTRNGHSYCTDNLGSTNLKDGYYNIYGKYLADIVKHFRDSLGINFNYVDPVNEPQWEWNGPSQEGNRASDSDIKNIVDSLYSALNADSVSTKILIPESGSLPDWYTAESSISSKYGKTYADFLDTLFNNIDIMNKAAKIFAGHSYWSDLLSSQLVQARQSLYQHMIQYFPLGYKYWVTEYCILQGPNGEGGNGRDLSMTTAINVDRIIHFDLTSANASAWQWWTAVSKYDYKDGLLYTNYVNPGNTQSIIQSKLLWAFGNYSRYIRPGSIRISCTGADNTTGLMASAYVDSSLGKVIIVLVNAATTDQKINLSLSGLDSTKSIKYFTPFVTSNSKGDDLRKYPSFPLDSVYDVPAYSVVTLIGMTDGSVYTAGTPGRARLDYPSSGDTLGVNDSLLVWNSVENASNYEVMISMDSTFSNAAIDRLGITDTVMDIKNYIVEPKTYPFPPNILATDTKYYWRVIASNDSGSGAYSEIRWFVTPSQVTGVTAEKNNLPKEYSVSQNYPNPFNPSTTIDFNLPHESSVRLQIFNSLGQMIIEKHLQTLVAGTHQVNIDMDRFASGIYFYRLAATDRMGKEFIVTKKMEFMK